MKSPIKTKPGEISPVMQLQYIVLRDEILKRIELRYQLMALCLTIAGILLGIGVNNSTVALTYAPLATFITTGWFHNNIRIRQLSHFISHNIESVVPGLGWDVHRAKIDSTTRFLGWSYETLSAGGIFIVTEILSILLGVTNSKGGIVDQVLFVINAISFLWLLIMLVNYRRQHRKYI